MRSGPALRTIGRDTRASSRNDCAMTLEWRRVDGGAQRLPSYVRDLHFVDGALIGIDVFGTVHRFGDGTWTTMVEKAMPDGVGVQATLPAWDGRIHGVGSDGRVIALSTSDWRWMEMAGPSDGPTSWPKVAFDASGSRLVAWGPRTPKGFKDDTWCFDGKAWTKAKKQKVAPADAIAGPSKSDPVESGAFALLYDPRIERVVRVGTMEASYLEGATWRGVPLAGGDLLGTWERTTWTDTPTGVVLCAQRFKRDAKLVRLDFAADSARATLAAALPPAVTRKPTDAGGNVLYDRHAFDSARRTLVVLDESSGARYEADLTALFA